MRRQPENNVSKRKVSARRVGTCFLQLRFEDHHMLVPMIDTGSDSLLVSVRWTVSHQCHKRVAPCIVELSCLPVHPLLNLGTCARICGKYIATTMLASEVTANHIRL